MLSLILKHKLSTHQSWSQLEEETEKSHSKALHMSFHTVFFDQRNLICRFDMVNRLNFRGLHCSNTAPIFFLQLQFTYDPTLWNDNLKEASSV